MIFFLFSTLFACTSDKSTDTGDNSDTSDINSPFAGMDYILVDTEGYDPISETISLSFMNASEFRFSGDCNGFSGSFSTDGSTFTTTMLSGTEIGCDMSLHNEDDWLVAFFTASPSFEFQEDSLILQSDEATLTFADRDVVIPDAALENSLWIIDSFIDGEDISTMNLTSIPNVTFSADGQVDLNTGCNGGFGVYALSGDTMTVTMEGYTDAICPDDISQSAEFYVTSVFMGPTLGVSLDENRLTLMNGSIGISAYTE